ncbi:MAG: LytR/AlgR family response regulator transcription factor [Mucilaginibacter sp.]
MKIKCLIVDDEPIARDILRRYCSQLPELEVVAECGNGLEARKVLLKEKIDVLFLDVNMPVMDGLAFLSTLKDAPQVIFTTAYKEYAANAFDLAACDYLVKPFSFERFIVAVDRASKKEPAPTPGSKEEAIFLRLENKMLRMELSEWLYAEAQGNHTKIVSSTGTLLPYLSFSAFEAMLPADLALRVHRSFLVNKNKVSSIEGNRLYIGQQEIPIGNHYRQSFLLALGLRDN